MKTVTLILVLLLAACSPPEEGIEGSWQFLFQDRDCAISYTFKADESYAGIFMCTRDNTADMFIEGGTYKTIGDTLIVSVVKSSCPEVSEKSWSVKYFLQNGGDTLSLAEDDGVLSLSRAPKATGSSGGSLIQTGCFTDSGFVQRPIQTL